MAAVVVTDTLDWRLHGFDLTSEHALTGDGCTMKVHSRRLQSTDATSCCKCTDAAVARRGQEHQ